MQATGGHSSLTAVLGAALLWALSGAACGGIEGPDDRFPDKAPGDITSPVAVGELLALGHPRELRAVWVATVWGIDYPKSAAASAATKEQELRDLIASLAASGFNAVFLQVRGESDALYPSALEPWARVLTGTQGNAPGFDPLAVAIEAAHQHGIELHAWINPYRARISGAQATAASHISNTHPSFVISYNNQLWLNPGLPAVRAHVLAVIEDLVARYAVDGIHFDDYFYPYPAAGQTFGDQATYNAYVAEGGTMSLGDWRRDNVNQLIAGVAGTLAANAPHVRFGISPFGVYRPGIPAGINGLDAYADIFADAPTWLANGWVDYLAPQLYWPTTQAAQSFSVLLAWWASLLDDSGRFIIAGMNTAAYQSTAAWSLDELTTQLALTTTTRDLGVRGAAAYNATSVVAEADVADLFANTWAEPALPPPVVQDPTQPALPEFSYEPATRQLSLPEGRFTLYQRQSATWTLADVVPGPRTLTLASGTFAIAAVGRNTRESSAMVVTLAAGDQAQQ